jgi:arginyl-tRNA synthetase
VLHRPIEERLHQAVRAVIPDADVTSILVRPCPEPKFGDYQSNSLIAVAKQRKLNPRQLATDVVAKLNVEEWCAPVEIAGPGFLNFRLKPSAIGAAVEKVFHGGPLFFEPVTEPRVIVVDFSSPNVAKPMHIGHIRSTALGDSLSRILRFLGHRVITDNHIGDWGTQFGKVIVGWKTALNPEALEKDALGEMERLYKTINAACETDPVILEQVRQELVKLQAGDPENLAIWKKMIELSQKQFDEIYGRLRVTFDHTLGESFYNPRLKSLVQELRDKNITQISDGATVVFFEDIPELKDKPALVEKRDGGANYTTTDLATLEYRVNTWSAQEIIYVTGGPQQLHFKQLFTIFGRWKPEVKVKLAHVWFGSILGADGKTMRTREGDAVRLVDVLDEAEERAYAIVAEKNPEMTEAEKLTVARQVGIGAVKYADLLPNRQTDYTFSWEKMLALNGNTAPYLQYAYSRVRSIFKKLDEETSGKFDATRKRASAIRLEATEEIALAKHLLGFGLVLEAVVADYRPNYLCSYLYELAGYFARFYENCPVLKAGEAEKISRLILCELTGRVLKTGLELLGIEAPERM